MLRNKIIFCQRNLCFIQKVMDLLTRPRIVDLQFHFLPKIYIYL